MTENLSQHEETSDFELEVKSLKLRTPTTGNQISGMPKSGKPWKKGSSKSHKKNIESNKALQSSWEDKMGRKENMKKMVEINRKMNDEKKRKVKTEAERLKQRAAQKEINTYKSASFQIIKNSKKLKKWSKKARSELSKLPTEIFEAVIKKEYNY